MKRSKTLIVLVIVLAALIAGIFIVKAAEKHIDEINKVDEIILSEPEAELNSFTVNRGDASLTLVKVDDVWYDSEDPAFPVDAEAVSGFLDNFAEVHASFVIEDIDSYSPYGLDKPECTIVFNSENGDTTLKLGGFSTMDSKRYVSVDDGRAFLIDEDLMDCVTTNRDDFIHRDKIPELNYVNEIRFSAADRDFTVRHDEEGSYCYSDAYNYYLVSGESMLPLSDSAVETLFWNVSSVGLTDYVSYTASTENLSEYRLDKPDVSVTVCGTVDGDGDVSEEAEYTVNFGCIVNKGAGENGEDTEDVYCRLGDSEMIYSVSSSLYDAIAGAEYNTLRPAELFAVDWENVKSLVFKLENTSYTAVPGPSTAEDAEEDETAWFINDEEVAFEAVISAINALSVSEYESSAASGLQELYLSVILNTKPATALTVNIYRHDGDTCAVSFNGDILGYIPRSQMVAAREALFTVVLNLAA